MNNDGKQWQICTTNFHILDLEIKTYPGVILLYLFIYTLFHSAKELRFWFSLPFQTI